ncbi:MAG: hypothetical protein HQ498_02365 [Pseudohongiella sp.]|nr:hypothetical protein [Pseudohongiella sp.]
MKTALSIVLLASFAFATSAVGQPQLSAAQSVMENARAICSFTEAAGTLTVTCTPDLASGSRLAFATAIANADAALSGNARPISFRIKDGGVFAEASPQTGIREVTNPAPPARSSVAPSNPRTIVVGTLADTVLEWRGKSLSTSQVGRDDQGLLVEWRYPDAIYLMGRRLQDGIEAYRVIKITPGSQ